VARSVIADQRRGRIMPLPLPLPLLVLAAPLLAPCAAASPQEPGAAQGAAHVRPAAVEVISELRVHGNHTTPDAQVIALAGVSVGQIVEPDTVAAIERRLRASGRFEAVEIRKRHRSLEDPTEVALVIVVNERAAAGGPDVPAWGPLRRARRSVMFLPVLDYADGYGFTYGLRTSFVGALGREGRLSVPLTWGGTKHAALEAEKAVERGPVHHLRGGIGISRRENPHYEIDDDRRVAWVAASREVVRGLRAGVAAGVTDVSFAALDDRFTTWGGDLTLDTRTDPIFPRNALFARAAWEAMALGDGPAIHRTSAEGRGYIALAGQTVLSARARYDHAGAPLPPYARWLLGGADTLRGHRAGSFSGDGRFVSSLEVRVPLGSPLTLAHVGVSACADVGAVHDHGQRLRDSVFHKGVGAGVFLLTPIFQVSLDVARGIGTGTRVHLGSGFTF
jgi:outer membrane protein assembly factor BamA